MTSEAQLTTNPTAKGPTASAPPRPIPSRRRKWYLALTLFFVFLFQEALFRVAFPMPEVAGFNRANYTQFHFFNTTFSGRTHGGLSRMIVRWESEPDGFAFDHTLNTYGFRGPDFAIDPPADRARVLFMGDSFTEGCGVADGETIPAQFGRLVEGKRPVEAINLGVAAAGFYEYGDLIRDAVPLLRPTAVFLVVYTNDLPAPPLPAYRRETPPPFPRLSPYVPRLAQVVGRMIDGSVVPRRFHAGPVPFFEPVPSPANPLTSKPAPDNLEPTFRTAAAQGKINPWNLALGAIHEQYMRHDYESSGGVKEHLRHFAAWTQRHQCRLVVVYIPYCPQVHQVYVNAQNRLGGPPITLLDQPQHRRQQEHLAAACRNAGIPFLDTTDAFIEAERTTGQRHFWPFDGHCNAAGCRFVADVCARFWNGER